VQIHFTEDDMAEYLLRHGYVIMVAVEEVEYNQYQNVFLQEPKEVIKAFKGDYSAELHIAFEREMKTQLLNK